MHHRNGINKNISVKVNIVFFPNSEGLVKDFGYSFRNVMFITEEVVNEGLFKEIAHFWFIQMVTFPEVNEKLKQATSTHLKASELDSRHMFLKAFA